MSTYPDFAATVMVPYRSEAFAEDLDDGPHPAPHRGRHRLSRMGWSAWGFMLPLAVAMVGSVSALTLS